MSSGRESTVGRVGGDRLRVLALEPYYGGSHRLFLDTLVKYSRHEFTLLTLPARKWKWRMRGAAMWFAEHVERHDPGNVDAVLTCDMMSIADWRSLAPQRLGRLPVYCYFHENQLTYPLSEHDRRDYQYGFTNITTCLAADRVVFNSAYHRDAFLQAADELLRQMPDHVPQGITHRISAKASVRRPSVEQAVDEPKADHKPDAPPVIVWNHRWEFDKNPDEFFDVLIELNAEGLDFRVVVLGQSFRNAPAAFERGMAVLGEKIIHRGFAPSRAEYWAWLRRSDIAVSTAIQENFGYAAIEAALAGCLPLLPNRLSYPEIIPAEFRSRCIYESGRDLRRRLRDLIRNRNARTEAGDLAEHLRTTTAPELVIPGFDDDLVKCTAHADRLSTDPSDRSCPPPSMVP